ncbi:Na+/H+ antiporter subunit E [Pontiellaceae bacterium B12227]|nr:Na+/H+ antiporter subunit E [Pontiellaceae bacterium B12227]
MTGPVLLAFCIWMLLTAEFSWLNAFIGLAGSMVVGLLNPYRFSARQLIHLWARVLIRLPQALWEALLIVLLPHRHERIAEQPVDHPESPWSVFSQTFLITFTPKSLVISEERDGRMQLHTVEREESE